MSGSFISAGSFISGRRRISSTLHLSALPLACDDHVEIPFRAKKIVDLRRRDRLQIFNAVFLFYIEQVFFQLELVTIVMIDLISLPNFVGILTVDGPESLCFVWRKVEPVGEEADLQRFELSCHWLGRPVLRRLQLCG